MFISAIDIFRIGPGPSSTHTVAPMRAARRFVHALEADGFIFQIRRVQSDLYGSIACAGRDQATDRAIIGGLCGHAPESVDAASLGALASRVRADGSLPLGRNTRIRFESDDVVFHVDKAFAEHSNAIRFTARNGRGETLASRLYFSTGDGDIVADGDPGDARTGVRVPHPFASAGELLAIGQQCGKKIADIMRTNELALRSPGEVHGSLVRVAGAMHASIERGLAADGTLPGPSRIAPARCDARRIARRNAYPLAGVGGRVLRPP